MARKLITIRLNSSNTLVVQDNSRVSVNVNPESGIQEVTVRPQITFVNTPPDPSGDIDGGTF